MSYLLLHHDSYRYAASVSKLGESGKYCIDHAADYTARFRENNLSPMALFQSFNGFNRFMFNIKYEIKSVLTPFFAFENRPSECFQTACLNELDGRSLVRLSMHGKR